MTTTKRRQRSGRHRFSQNFWGFRRSKKKEAPSSQFLLWLPESTRSIFLCLSLCSAPNSKASHLIWFEQLTCSTLQGRILSVWCRPTHGANSLRLANNSGIAKIERKIGKSNNYGPIPRFTDLCALLRTLSSVVDPWTVHHRYYGPFFLIKDPAPLLRTLSGYGLLDGPYWSVFSMVRSGRGWSMVHIGPYSQCP